jgi:hypothetical protein
MARFKRREMLYIGWISFPFGREVFPFLSDNISHIGNPYLSKIRA